jgi:transcriptional regulator with XRE-family HTH domain
VTRVAELARARAFRGLTEEDCEIWFGVGSATLERIEAGEVEPSDELDQRINRFLNVVGGGGFPFPPPTPGSSLQRGEPTGAGAAVAPGPGANFGEAFEGGPIHANRGTL